MSTSLLASVRQLDLPPIGAQFEGGYLNGLFIHNGQLRAQVSASKRDGGHHAPTVWHNKSDRIDGALDFVDGAASTKAMATAGSRLAQWALDLRIGGHDDWHLPALLQLERIYRMAKPTTDGNLYSYLDGQNFSSWPPSGPYTRDFPAQTLLIDFQPGGAEAFEPIGMWSATQHAGFPGNAWVQNFDDGGQYWGRKDYEFGAVAVRSVVICPLDYSVLRAETESAE